VYHISLLFGTHAAADHRLGSASVIKKLLRDLIIVKGPYQSLTIDNYGQLDVRWVLYLRFLLELGLEVFHA
jgi:hypothetical protein